MFLGISGDHTDNCIPLHTWLDAESETVSLQLTTDEIETTSQIDVIATCHSQENMSRLTWSKRRNAFSPDDECFQCGPCTAGNSSQNARCIVGEGDFTCQCDLGEFKFPFKQSKDFIQHVMRMRIVRKYLRHVCVTMNLNVLHVYARMDSVLTLSVDR